MDAAQEERLARNEAFFRDVNERINDVASGLGDDAHEYSFFCECSDTACAERLSLSLADYEFIRAEPTRFVLAPGHARKELEQVIEREDDHDVVEKNGLAGAIAAELDTRDPS